jgi:bifunctional non-homologous end joining protein LigD
MALEEYHKKRHFDRTPEPKGEAASSPGRRLYLIQKHDASRLHYDFRLEDAGVLLSWAVPKGPSLDPHERRLAVQVEDHPLDYGDFEGIIPEGEYGGGTVLLWDRGSWEPVGDPVAGLRKGHLKFHLEGEKLRGGWALVRLRGDGDDDRKNWLLIKENDDTARPGSEGDVLEERPESVATGRELPEIAADPDRVWSSNREATAKAKAQARAKATAAPKAVAKSTKKGTSAAMPAFVAPQLATLVGETPQGEGWIHEIKLDGYRALAAVAGGESCLYTRNEHDVSAKFATVAAAAAALPVESALLDGEIVAITPDGRTSFQSLQNLLRGDRSVQIAYFAFDLLELDGKDLRRRPLLERKAALAGVIARAGGGVVRYSDHVLGQGDAFFAQACRMGIEGVIAKREDAPYRSGRSRDWLKVKCISRQELVIGGWTDPEGARSALGALLVGVYDGDELRFAGKVGTGFDQATLEDLHRRLKPLELRASPFANPPRGAEARGVHWVEPELVAEFSFAQWTDDGKLRHASYQGLRIDKAAREVVRETPAPPPAGEARSAKGGTAAAPKPSTDPRHPRSSKTKAKEGAVAGIQLSHPDRVLYADTGLTKLGLARYYEAVAPWILPFLDQRPLSLVRCPEGQGKECFFQKHLRDNAAPALRSVVVREDDGDSEPYPWVADAAGLVSLVQMGVLELHGWGALADDVERPDRVVFDFDPDPSVPWERVVEGALRMRQLLDLLGLASFVQTTGGKGLHVVAPLVRRRTWDEVKPFARAVADTLVADSPKLYLSKASKAARKGKIFIDWLRNGRGATAIVAYSTRAREGAPVAVPLAWEEVIDVKPRELTVETVPKRLAALEADPWAEYWTTRQSIRKDALKKLGLAGG